MAEFNALLQEVLVGTELLMDEVKTAETREAVVGAIRCRKSNGTLANAPPSRVMILTDLMSKWANVTYSGCRYLREAPAETLRKYSVLHEYLREQGQESIFERSLGEEEESYVLLHLTMDQCTPDRRAPYQPLAIRGWGELQGSSIPVPEFNLKGEAFEWVAWSSKNCR